MNRIHTLWIFFWFLTVSPGLLAQHETQHEEKSSQHSEQHEESGDIKSEIKSIVNHHLMDSHDFVFYHSEKTGESLSIPLPVILWDDGLHIFMSSKFHFGENVVEEYNVCNNEPTEEQLLELKNLVNQIICQTNGFC